MKKSIARYDIPLVLVPTWALKTSEPFSTLFPIRESVLSEIIDDMNENGFDNGHPIVVWDMTVIDGHARLRAAIATGIEMVPIVSRDFENEEKALEYAIQSQRNRRNLTDGELLQCLQKLDFRKPRGKNAKNHGKSSDSIAEILGISRNKVEKLRAIMDYGTDDVKEALRLGKYTVNGAYQATMTPRRKKPEITPDTDAGVIHSVMSDIHARLNITQIRKLVKALQIELAIN